jgi:hypothetical protein
VNGMDNADARHSFARLIRNPKEAYGERFRDHLRLGQDKPRVDSARKVSDLVMVPNGACSRTEDL